MPILPIGSPSPSSPSFGRQVETWKKQLQSLTDEEKQSFLDTLGEIVGGTLGGTAGFAMGGAAGGIGAIPGSMVGAGGGAALGRIAARSAGPMMGLQVPPESPSRMAMETTKSALGASAGEGVGRTIPLGFKGAKNWIGEKVYSYFKPTAEALELAKLADKYDIPLNLAQRSGRPWLQQVEIALDRSPFTIGQIRKFRQGQYTKWENAISGWLDKYRRGEVSPEEFARVAEDAFASLRSDFNAKLAGEAKTVAKGLHPVPVSAIEAAEGLKAGRQSNIRAVKDWATQTYGAIRKKIGDVPVDLSSLPALTEKIGPEARALFDQQAQMYIEAAEAAPKGLLEGTLKTMGAKSLEEVKQKLSPEAYASIVDRLTQEGALGSKIEMPLSKALEMRTSLIENVSRLTDRSHAMDVRAVHSVLDGINQSIESSVKAAADAASDPVQKKLLSDSFLELKKTNAQYRSFMEKLYPPRSEGGKGNIAAGILRSEKRIPESLPPQIVKSPTLTAGAEAAASPETVLNIAPSAVQRASPMGPLRRSIFDESVEASRIANPATGESRISPTKMGLNLPPASPELYRSSLPAVEGLGRTGLVAREQLLYSSPFAKAVEAGRGAGSVMSAAFPRKAPERAGVTLGILGETGQADIGRRAFLEDLINRSRTQEKTIGDIRYLNPRTLERNLAGYGETIPEVIGPGGVDEAGNLIEAGKGITAAEHLLGNVSGTARAGEAIRNLRMLANPLEWGKAAKEAAATMWGAGKFVDPEFAAKRVLPPTLTPITPGGATSGLVGRSIIRPDMLTQPSIATPKDEDEEWFKQNSVPALKEEDEEWFRENSAPAP